MVLVHWERQGDNPRGLEVCSGHNLSESDCKVRHFQDVASGIWVWGLAGFTRLNTVTDTSTQQEVEVQNDDACTHHMGHPIKRQNIFMHQKHKPTSE